MYGIYDTCVSLTACTIYLRLYTAQCKFSCVSKSFLPPRWRCLILLSSSFLFFSLNIFVVVVECGRRMCVHDIHIWNKYALLAALVFNNNNNNNWMAFCAFFSEWRTISSSFCHTFRRHSKHSKTRAQEAQGETSQPASKPTHSYRLFLLLHFARYTYCVHTHTRTTHTDTHTRTQIQTNAHVRIHTAYIKHTATLDDDGRWRV